MQIEITFTGTLNWVPDYDGDTYDSDKFERELDELFDATMENLLGSEFIADPILAGSVGQGTLEVTVLASGDSIADAIVKADGALRAAFHGAGFGTRDWTHPLSRVRPSVEWQHVQADKSPLAV